MPMMNQETHSHLSADPSNLDKKPKFDSIKTILGTLGLFILAPLIALILVSFVFQSYRVDGESMEQTLSNNDRLIVNKIPKTFARVTGSHYIPDRYEIVVFKKNESIGLTDYGDRQLIKRVIGLPGERVVVKNGQVTIYNDDSPEGFSPDKSEDYAESTTNTEGNIDVTIKENEVFVMGDNRNNSLDSRSFGPIYADDIVGILAFRIFPLG